MTKIEKYTIGMGDRFARQGEAQLGAVVAANNTGIPVYPTWNKSFREHSIVGSEPDGLRAEADAAVAALGWEGSYYVDADHIGLKTVDSFMAGSNFFTLDVAEQVGEQPTDAEMEAFLRQAEPFLGELRIPGIQAPFIIDEELLRRTANQFLSACIEAGRIYRYILDKKGEGNFITEVSIDETHSPQGPVELFLILVMLAGQKVPAQTIAPKFSGRFNKGVEYVGDVARFEEEFDADLHVLAHAVRVLGLPESLKLSVHSGSDKFSLYPVIKRCLKKHRCGLHVKTAGTTWLEEVIGLAEAGGDGLAVAKEIYSGAFSHYEELTAPYATVIDIDRAQLPEPETVQGWDSDTYVRSLRHVPGDPLYNPHFRQLLHVGFKIAAKMGDRYQEALAGNAEIIARNVRENLLERHIRPIFPKK